MIICTRSKKPGARQAAIEELAKVFAGDSLMSVPSILVWWEDIRYEKVVSLIARKMRQALGLSVRAPKPTVKGTPENK